MAERLTRILKVDEVQAHPDPETTALELAIVKGWQCVVKKGSVQKGELCVYFPLDSVLPAKLSDLIGVTNYLSKGRIRAVKLRGTPSYGLLWPVKDAKAKETDWVSGVDKTTLALPRYEEEEDVTGFYGITKWEPPLHLNSQEMDDPHPLFFTYTDIQNLRDYPQVLTEGEEVVIMEKIHGTNARHAVIEGTLMVGGHNHRLKEKPNSRYWFPFSESMKSLLRETSAQLQTNRQPGNVIIFDEVYGDGVQDLKYGLTKGKVECRVFDIFAGTRYMDSDLLINTCARHAVPLAPILYHGPFSMDKVRQFTTSKSTVPGADNIMEGVVVRPVKERTNPLVGRVILKYLFDQYLCRKGGTEDH
jgi:RNA ligase (TIGR02306 family)